MRIPGKPSIGFLTCVAANVVLAVFPVATTAMSEARQNAAVVYYQAYLFKSVLLHPPEGFWQVSSSFDTRFDPNSAIRSFVRSRDFQELTELVTAASRMPRCDWGLVRRQRLSIVPQISALRELTDFLVIHAKVSACDGQYKAALENALTMRRVARHFGDDTLYMHMHSEGANHGAFAVIQYVLGKMPPDAEILAWLEQELAAGGELKWRPRETLMKWLNWEVECLGASTELLAKLAENPLGLIDAPPRKKDWEDLTPMEALQRARLAWQGLFESLLEILESEKTYQEKHREIGQLETEATVKINQNGPFALMANLMAAMGPQYDIDLSCRAREGAVRAAIAVYRVKAITGELPKTLPADVPKDPYSGKDFAYQTTEEGFVLGCRAKPASAADDTQIRQFEFRVTASQDQPPQEE